ncbi:MAG: hypothetical protein E7285_07470 [Lachnospiraceae bacterium]|nr:hypothetical protein [Lachnospiraceae bacterium]
MKITNEIFMHCPSCGRESAGLEEINRVFGYKIVKDEIRPYTECKNCRSEKEGRECKKKEWASAASWGREMNISRRAFDGYLMEMGYLEPTSDAGKRSGLSITREGRRHSATTNAPFRKAILWDFDTYVEVVRMRASKMIVYKQCPKCKANVDTIPGGNDDDHSRPCPHCGNLCDYWEISVV